MATKTTKTTKTSDTLTEAQMAAMLAENPQFAAFVARQNAAAEKAARENAAEPGFRPIPVTPADIGKNILARCRYNTAGMPPIFGTAIMVDGGKRRLSVATTQGFTPGVAVVGGEAGDLSAILAHVAEKGIEMEAYLVKTYEKAAKNHTFVAKKKESK